MAVKKMIKKVNCFSLELTNICNIDCDFCANRLMTREKGVMDIELAKRIIKEVKDTKFCDEITTNLMGEPLLYKDLFTLLKYANTLGQDISLITNGESLDRQTTLKLFEYPPSIVTISYHSNNDETQKHKHSCLSYAQFKERIFEFIELKFKLKAKTPVYMMVISTFSNPHDKFKILDNKQDMETFKKEWINFAKFIKKKYGIFWQIPHSIYPGRNMLLPDFCISLSFSYHLWLNDILPQGTKVIPSSQCLCPAPFGQFNILWNGDVTLCCHDYNGDLVYDNIRNKRIIETFNSDEIFKIRKNLIEGKDIHNKCAYCYGRIINADGSEYNPVRKFYRLPYLDNFKRRYFRIYRFLWNMSNFKFNYKKFLPYLIIHRYFLRRCCAKYYNKFEIRKRNS